MHFIKVIRKVNLVLSAVIVMLSLVIVGYPFIPEISYAYSKNLIHDDGLVYLTSTAANQDLKKIPKENRIVIPKILVDSEIFEGEDKATLDKGMWRRPNTSTPDKGGNTVIVAHRFLYTNGPNTFYHLDKMQTGDLISVYWEQKEYVYKVEDVFEVLPNKVEIEASSNESMLTLYTCTPIFTAEKRLVVRAKLV